MRGAAAALIGAVVGAAVAGTAGPPVDHRALAARIVAQMRLGPGERVLLLAGPAESPALVEGLRAEVARAGGIALVRTGGAADPMPDFDVAVALPGASSLGADYRAAHAALSGRRRAVHFHWRGLDPSPSAWAAPGHALPPHDVIDSVYERAVLRSDCPALGADMQRFASALRRGAARVTTPRGTDLRFEVGDRPVNVQDGDASAARAEKARIRVDRDVEIPCGVLRVAPIEETVTGAIVFPPARWDGREVASVKMTFDKGRVVDVQAAEGGGAAVEAELQRGGPAARSFREFALGFNPALAVPEKDPWIPYYGYGAGVVRLSLGDNTELGGKVGGGYVRWNFFTDATVEAGGAVWVRSGVLLAR